LDQLIKSQLLYQLSYRGNRLSAKFQDGLKRSRLTPDDFPNARHCLPLHHRAGKQPSSSWGIQATRRFAAVASAMIYPEAAFPETGQPFAKNHALNNSYHRIKMR
jgi:hypothetical protein